MAHYLSRTSARIPMGTFASTFRSRDCRLGFFFADLQFVKRGNYVSAPYLARISDTTSFQVEVVNAAERAAGRLPRAHQVTVAFADIAGFTTFGRGAALCLHVSSLPTLRRYSRADRVERYCDGCRLHAC